MKLYILLILCLFVTSFLEAQEKSDKKNNAESGRCAFSGHIVSPKDNMPIFAMIYLPESKLWAVSNREGKFSISQVPVGKVKVQVSIIGYKERELEVTLFKTIDRCKGKQ